MALPGPFHWKTSTKLTPVPFPAAELDKLRRTTSGFDAMGIALIDISGPSTNCFAQNWSKTGFAASLPKIAAMYAAFTLQRQVAAARMAMPTASIHELERALKKEWLPVMKNAVPVRVGDFPDISAIFDGSIKFQASYSNDMKKMIKKSDNSAAGRCIRKVGYDYLNGALAHGGFFSAAGKSGLWLSGDYVQGSGSRDGLRAPGLTSSQAASAEAVTTMLVDLAHNKLVNAEASREMKAIMHDAYSWINYTVADKHPDAKVYGKLGLGKGQSTHDCAIVRHGNAEYVAVTLFGKGGLSALHEELDRVAMTLFLIRKGVKYMHSVGKELVRTLSI